MIEHMRELCETAGYAFMIFTEDLRRSKFAINPL